MKVAWLWGVSASAACIALGGLLPACGGDDGASASGPSGGLGGGGSGGGGQGGTAGAAGAAGAAGVAGSSGSSGGGGWPSTCTAGEACYSGPPGTDVFGSCRAGITLCAQGQQSGCQGEVLPTEELCNGLDDDCDGEVDEGCSCTEGVTQNCYSGPLGTQGIGQCQGGIQTCLADGSWSPTCAGEVRPSAESCNGVDNDCNGVVDDVTSVRLHRLQFPGLTWSSQALGEAWTGTNAPSPCTPIETVINAYDFGHLMVFTSSGQLHLRDNGTWQPPVAANSRFDQLPVVLDAVYQLPWEWASQHGGARRTHITFGHSPTAGFYLYQGQPFTLRDDIVNLPPGQGNEPNRANHRDRWSFERLDPGVPFATFGILVSSHDGALYEMDLNTAWTAWPNPRTHRYFSSSSAPDPNSCVAAWFDMPIQAAYFICS